VAAAALQHVQQVQRSSSKTAGTLTSASSSTNDGLRFRLSFLPFFFFSAFLADPLTTALPFFLGFSSSSLSSEPSSLPPSSEALKSSSSSSSSSHKPSSSGRLILAERDVVWVLRARSDQSLGWQAVVCLVSISRGGYKRVINVRMALGLDGCWLCLHFLCLPLQLLLRCSSAFAPLIDQVLIAERQPQPDPAAATANGASFTMRQRPRSCIYTLTTQQPPQAPVTRPRRPPPPPPPPPPRPRPPRPAPGGGPPASSCPPGSWPPWPCSPRS